MRLYDTLDRIVYMFGIYQTFFTIFFLGYNIHYAKIFHLIKFCILIPYRLVQFRKVKKHYYMFEFCYLANALMAIYLAADLYCQDMCTNSFVQMILYRDHLFHLVYSLAFGPLIWAIFMNGDRMYFHSPQHLISVFIHLDPSLLAWMIRWENDTVPFNEYYAPNSSISNIIKTYKYFLTLALPVYVLWAVSYYVWIFVMKRSRLGNNEYKMSYKDATSKGHMAYNLINMTNVPMINEILYMIFHALAAVISIFIASALYNNYTWNTCMVLILFTAASWNASYKYTKLIYNDEKTSIKAQEKNDKINRE